MLGCAGFFVLLIPITAALMFPIFAQAREKARQISCLSNLKEQGLAVIMYSQDYDGKLPAADKWMDLATPYIKREEVLHCPSVATGDRSLYGYAYNDKMSKANVEKIADPQTTALTYDSSSTGRNAHDAMTSLPPQGRHLRGNNIAYADGHAKHNRVTAPND
jgi:prepilin-type processing-associated H-X9-DG protein